jgi:hypothetical protein
LFLLQGCTLLSSRLEAHFEQQKAIATVCAQPEFSQVDIRAKFQTDISDLVSLEFGLPLQALTTDKATILSGMADIQQHLSALVRYVSPANQASLKAALSDLKKLQDEGGQLKQQLNDSVKNVLSKHPLTLTNASADFGAIVTAVTPEIRVGLASFTTDGYSWLSTYSPFFAKLPLDTGVLQNLNEIQDELNAIPKDSQNIGSAIDDVLKNVKSILRTAWEPNLSSEARSILEDILNNLIIYETARLITNEAARGARSIEYKLDQIDEKTWFIITVLGFAVSDGVEQDAAKRLDELFLNHAPKVADKSDATQAAEEAKALETDVADAFIVAACTQLSGDASGVPTNSARAAALLQPFFETLVLAANGALALTVTKTESVTLPVPGPLAPVAPPTYSASFSRKAGQAAATSSDYQRAGRAAITHFTAISNSFKAYEKKRREEQAKRPVASKAQ